MAGETIKLINELCEKFGVAIDWGSENMLPYLNELFSKCIRYEVTTSVCFIAVALIPIIVTLSFCAWLNKKDENGYKNWVSMDDEIFVYMALILTVFDIVAIIALILNIHDIITCLTFPEKIFIEMLQKII